MDLSSESRKTVGVYPIPEPTKTRFKHTVQGAFSHHNRHLKTWSSRTIKDKPTIELEVPSLKDGPFDIYEKFVLCANNLTSLQVFVGNKLVWNLTSHTQLCLALECYKESSRSSVEWWSLPLRELQPLFTHAPLRFEVECHGASSLSASTYRIEKTEFQRYMLIEHTSHYEDFLFVEPTVHKDGSFCFDFEGYKLLATRLSLWNNDAGVIVDPKLNDLCFWKKGTPLDRLLFDETPKRATFGNLWVLQADPPSPFQGTGCYYLQKGKVLTGRLDVRLSRSLGVNLCIQYRTAMRGTKPVMEPIPWTPSPICYPLTKDKDGRFLEGFWQAKDTTSFDSSPLPFPQRSKGDPVSDEWKAKLKALCSRCDRKGWFHDCFGSSRSRLTDTPVGNREYHVTVDKTAEHQRWTFPEGVLHYYCEEGVKPSDEFYSLVDSFDYEDTDFDRTPHYYLA